MAFAWFSEEVNKRSKGALDVQFHGSTLLSKELEIMNAVKAGNIAIGDPGGAAATVFPEMGVFLVPYLVRSYDQAYKMFNGKIGDRLDKQFQEKYKLKVLCFFDYGFRHFWNNKRPIVEPKDLRGMKMRVQQAKVFGDTINGLGGNAVPMAWGEVIPAAQSGVIDGADLPIVNILALKAYEVSKYCSMTFHNYGPTVNVINLQVWNGLTTDEQKLLLDVSREAQERIRKDTESVDNLAEGQGAPGAQGHGGQRRRCRCLPQGGAGEDLADLSEAIPRDVGGDHQDPGLTAPPAEGLDGRARQALPDHAPARMLIVIRLTAMNASAAAVCAPRRPRAGRHWIATIPKIIVAAILFVVMVDLLVGVFLRYVVVPVTDYFDLPSVSFFWVEEVGEFALAWLTAVGAAVAIIERTHFALAVFTQYLSPRTRTIVERINHALIAGFGALVAIYGWKIAMLNSMLESPGLEINLAWLYGSAVVGGTLTAIYGVAVVLGIMRLNEPACPGRH